MLSCPGAARLSARRSAVRRALTDCAWRARGGGMASMQRSGRLPGRPSQTRGRRSALRCVLPSSWRFRPAPARTSRRPPMRSASAGCVRARRRAAACAPSVEPVAVGFTRSHTSAALRSWRNAPASRLDHRDRRARVLQISRAERGWRGCTPRAPFTDRDAARSASVRSTPVRYSSNTGNEPNPASPHG